MNKIINNNYNISLPVSHADQECGKICADLTNQYTYNLNKILLTEYFATMTWKTMVSVYNHVSD